MIIAFILDIILSVLKLSLWILKGVFKLLGKLLRFIGSKIKIT